MKSLKMWLRESRRRHARIKMPSRPHKEQLGKVSSKIWDSSQIENEQEEEEENCREEIQMESQWAEDETLEESRERRREGSSLQAEVMQKGT